MQTAGLCQRMGAFLLCNCTRFDTSKTSQGTRLMQARPMRRSPGMLTLGLMPAAGSVALSTPLNGLFLTDGCSTLSSGYPLYREPTDSVTVPRQTRLGQGTMHANAKHAHVYAPIAHIREDRLIAQRAPKDGDCLATTSVILLIVVWAQRWLRGRRCLVVLRHRRLLLLIYMEAREGQPGCVRCDDFRSGLCV